MILISSPLISLVKTFARSLKEYNPGWIVNSSKGALLLATHLHCIVFSMLYQPTRPETLFTPVCSVLLVLSMLSDRRYGFPLPALEHLLFY